MLTLYQFELSPFCDKVRRILHVKRVPYRVVNVPVATSQFRIKQVNPIGKVPAIETEDGTRVADSTDIARWLEQHHPSPALYPSSPRDRALCHVLEDWADESLYFYEVLLRFTLPHNQKRWFPELLKHEGAVVKSLAPFVLQSHFDNILKPQGLGRKPLEMVLRELDAHLDAVMGILDGREWLVGDWLTVADISVYAQLACILPTVEGEAAFTKRPELMHWMDRVAAATAADKPPTQ